MSDRCCENCDGVVYKADSVIDTTYLLDKCKTIESRVCRILPGIPHNENYSPKSRLKVIRKPKLRQTSATKLAAMMSQRH